MSIPQRTPVHLLRKSYFKGKKSLLKYTCLHRMTALAVVWMYINICFYTYVSGGRCKDSIYTCKLYCLEQMDYAESYLADQSLTHLKVVQINVCTHFPPLMFIHATTFQILFYKTNFVNYSTAMKSKLLITLAFQGE